MTHEAVIKEVLRYSRAEGHRVGKALRGWTDASRGRARITPPQARAFMTGVYALLVEQETSSLLFGEEHNERAMHLISSTKWPQGSDSGLWERVEEVWLEGAVDGILEHQFGKGA